MRPLCEIEVAVATWRFESTSGHAMSPNMSNRQLCWLAENSGQLGVYLGFNTAVCCRNQALSTFFPVSAAAQQQRGIASSTGSDPSPPMRSHQVVTHAPEGPRTDAMSPPRQGSRLAGVIMPQPTISASLLRVTFLRTLTDSSAAAVLAEKPCPSEEQRVGPNCSSG